MPFKSDAQRRFMFAVHPDIASRWSKHKVSEGPQDLDWEEIEGFTVAKTPAGYYNIAPGRWNIDKPEYVDFHPAPGSTAKYWDSNVDSMDDAKAKALAHWKQLQHTRKYDEPLPMPASLQKVAHRGGTQHGHFNRGKPRGIELNSVVREMPHIDADIDMGGKHVSIIDLRIERYPIPDAEKKRLFKAFSKTGIVGELGGEMFHFRPDYTVDVIEPSAASKLPRLPRGWEKSMMTVTESSSVGLMYAMEMVRISNEIADQTGEEHIDEIPSLLAVYTK